jgi:hypothetical protein
MIRVAAMRQKPSGRWPVQAPLIIKRCAPQTVNHWIEVALMGIQQIFVTGSTAD